MSDDQLSALLARLKEDNKLREMLLHAEDSDTALATAKSEGFDLNKTDWQRFIAQQSQDLTDEQLEAEVGGTTALQPGAGAGSTANEYITQYICCS